MANNFSSHQQLVKIALSDLSDHERELLLRRAQELGNTHAFVVVYGDVLGDDLETARVTGDFISLDEVTTLTPPWSFLPIGDLSFLSEDAISDSAIGVSDPSMDTSNGCVCLFQPTIEDPFLDDLHRRAIEADMDYVYVRCGGVSSGKLVPRENIHRNGCGRPFDECSCAVHAVCGQDPRHCTCPPMGIPIGTSGISHISAIVGGVLNQAEDPNYSTEDPAENQAEDPTDDQFDNFNWSDIYED